MKNNKKVKTLKIKPLNDGYYMPGEFEKQNGVFMLWPQRNDNWRNNAKHAQEAFVEVATAISKFEKVIMGVNDDRYENSRNMLPREVEVVIIENNDSWARDCGPTKLINNKGYIRNVSWVFNAWGGLVDGLYHPWDKDDKVAKRFSKLIGIDYYQAPFVLEGGSIHVDGQGTLFTTEACLLSKGRNPNLSKKEIEILLKEYLGVKKVIWLPNGIYGDETNEHIDNMLQVVEPGHVLLHWTNDKNDPQYNYSKKAYDILTKTRDAKGRRIKVTKLIVPSPLITITKEESEGIKNVEGTLPRNKGDRMAASYINHLIINEAVIVPQFGIETDKVAINTLKEVYKNRKIIPIKRAREIILGGGNIHCITQQF